MTSTFLATSRSFVSALYKSFTGITTAAVRSPLLLRNPIGRRRLFIIVAGLFVCGYALGVLLYSISIPDIGLRCAFSRVVNRALEEFIVTAPGESPPVLEGYSIVKLGDRKVTN